MRVHHELGWFGGSISKYVLIFVCGDKLVRLY